MQLTRSAYTSIEDMPLRNFVKAITTNDMDWLICDNKWYLPKPNLENVWEQLFQQYIERTKDPKSNKIFQLVRDITVIGNYINISNQAISHLSTCRTLTGMDGIKDALRSMLLVRCQFTEETLLNDIKICLSAVKRLKIKHADLTAEYKQLQGREQQKVSETDFTEQIVSLEKIHGISIDYRNISVSKYISYIDEAKREQKNG